MALRILDETTGCEELVDIRGRVLGRIRPTYVGGRPSVMITACYQVDE